MTRPFTIVEIEESCDGCGISTEHSKNYHIAANPTSGMNLCSYCMLMLNNKLDEFHRDEEG